MTTNRVVEHFGIRPYGTSLSRAAVALRRIGCTVPEKEQPESWQIAPSKAEYDTHVIFSHDTWLAHSQVREMRDYEHRADPVEAGVRAVAPDAAAFHAYYMAAMDEAITELRRGFESRLAKLEAALAERNAPAGQQRGQTLIADTIAALRAHLGEEDEPSLEEEIELWKLVDFSATDDED